MESAKEKAIREELWQDIEELNNDYQISNFGQVKSKERIVEFSYPGGSRFRKVKEKILKLSIKKQEDGRIDSVIVNIRHYDYQVSRLVYKYFNDDSEVEKGFCIAHVDKNPLNNNDDNLIKVTWSESRRIDHKKSKRTKIAQQNRSQKGADAMKLKATLKKQPPIY